MINHVVVLTVFGLTALCGGLCYGALRGAGWSTWAAIGGAAVAMAGTFVTLAALHSWLDGRATATTSESPGDLSQRRGGGDDRPPPT